MVEKVIRAQILFFDSNPIGRILTRFSKDVTALDLVMPNIAVLASFGIFRALTVAMVVCFIHYEMLAVIGVVVILMLLVARRARNVMRESQRMDSVFRGPIHSTFTNIVNGLVSLRAYERLGYFRESFLDQLERSCNISFTYISVNRWMGICLDQICLTFTAGTSIFSVFAKTRVDPEFLAFTL